ncbi:MAG TPA: GNAT family N-acetyltransferase [Chthoniobacter sp.]|nr:GNAT family N-acetyltransferase [Chthoniobacter sp.]
MFGWLRRLFSTSKVADDLALHPADGHIKPLRIRSYTPNDFAACREFYVLNEPGRFPEGVLPEFEKSLQSERSIYLVAEKDGVLCGCGGVVIIEQHGRAALCFGLVHPEYHKQGIGTALLLARIAILPEDQWFVTLSPVPASRSFYERFNFREFTRFQGTGGVIMPLHYARVSPDTSGLCRKRLIDAGVTLDVSTMPSPIRGQQ